MEQNKTMTYQSEIMDVLNRLYQENHNILEFKYFLDTAYIWFHKDFRRCHRPSIGVLGSNVPEELILAAGTTPYFVMGGSLKSTSWSDDMVPRDTDPISRSILGFLMEPDGPDYSETLFIIPTVSDSMRKIAYILNDKGYSTHVVDIPPDRRDPLAEIKWKNQMSKLTAVISKHMGKPIGTKNIKEAIRLVDTARTALDEFLRLTNGREDLITGSGRMLVQNSYYYTRNLKNWTMHLIAMNRDIEMRIKKEGLNPAEKTHNPKSNVLLLGSPILFPNYKIPFLIEDIGLSIGSNLDTTSFKFGNHQGNSRNRGNKDSLIRNLSDCFLKEDTSSAYAVNEVMYRNVEEIVKSENIDGLVYHVLKGQIEYDFELDRIEQLSESYDLPLFRLETDYQYQDVEQLRIRLEAFAEMLSQNRYIRQKGSLA